MTSRDIAVAATTAAGMYVLAQIPIGPSMSAVGTEFEIDQLPELPENWPFTIKDAQILFAGPNAEEQKEDIEVEIVDGKLPNETINPVASAELSILDMKTEEGV